MFRIISVAAFAAVLSVPLVASPALSSAGPGPIGPDDESAGTTVPLEVVHVETDTNFDDTSTQGTVLFAETVAPTASAQPGWWLRMDVTVRNIGDQPIEITEVGITTETGALDVESLEDPISVAPGGTALIKPHDATGSGTAPTWFTVNFYAPASAPFPAQGTYPLETYDNATATGGFRFPARAEDLPAGVFWTPGGFHAHSRGQRYAYDLKAIRWDYDREEWTKYTEQAFDDAANGITLGSKNEHHLIWGQPVYAMASGWSVSCRRSEPDHQPGQANSVPGANVISIEHGNGEIAAYAHLMQNTLPTNLCAAEAPVDDDDAPRRARARLHPGRPVSRARRQQRSIHWSTPPSPPLRWRLRAAAQLPRRLHPHLRRLRPDDRPTRLELGDERRGRRSGTPNSSIPTAADGMRLTRTAATRPAAATHPPGQVIATSSPIRWPSRTTIRSSLTEDPTT